MTQSNPKPVEGALREKLRALSFRIDKPISTGLVLSLEDALKAIDEEAALSAAPARDGVREALKWALDWIADGTNPEIGDTPEHGCAYFKNPVAGHCEWHERYFAARELLAKEQADGQ